MMIAAAAVLYFLIVFGVGFLLGPIRVLLLEPRIGQLAAVLLEAPFLIAAIVLAARWVPRWCRVAPATGPLLAVGLGALALQQVADLLVGLKLRGMGAAEQLARFVTLEGAVYAALLVLFALMPLLANRPAPRGPGDW